MPVYEYRCQKCKKRFSITESITEHGTKKMRCPKCKSTRIDRVYESFSAQQRCLPSESSRIFAFISA